MRGVGGGGVREGIPCIENSLGKCPGAGQELGSRSVVHF